MYTVHLLLATKVYLLMFIENSIVLSVERPFKRLERKKNSADVT